MSNAIRYLVIVSIIVVLAASRLVPHPWNFTPVTAMALFAGAFLADRRAAFGIPIVALLLSDMVLNLGVSENPLQVWLVCGLRTLCIPLIVLLGQWVGQRRTVVRIAGATLLCSILFFVLTNFFSWLVFNPYTLPSLVQCYVDAIPFFRWTLAGDLIYTTILFGGFALAEHCVAALCRRPAADVPHAQIAEPEARTSAAFADATGA